ncbi:MAG TPA: hypothetical protein QKA08_03475 [Candidatus Megaira endosymbiont of Nemacystus decipiens]|nr:hypothetical protein [Candidatus Megaera endosymbiont of Nemacystus decipiens]
MLDIRKLLDKCIETGMPITELMLRVAMRGESEVKVPSYTIPKTLPGKPLTIKPNDKDHVKITVHNPQGADLTNIEIKEFPPSVSFDHEGQHHEVPILGEQCITFDQHGVTIG